MEDAGRIRRGYFVDGLGAAQFALAGALDRLRAVRDPAERAGRGRGPPARRRRSGQSRTARHCPGRVAARPIGGRSSARRAPTSCSSTGSRRSTSSAVAPRSRRCPPATTRPWRSPRPGPRARSSIDGRIRELVLRKVDGEDVGASRRSATVLLEAGFVAGYRGLVLRPQRSRA